MVKPLHAGLAARNGVVAALLAKAGMTASTAAIDGPQGFLAAMDSEQPSLDAIAADLGVRWEIVDTGITVKLYPSCAGTHPALDALLDLRQREPFAGEDVDAVEIGVDPIVPTILIYDRPSTALEGKFSMPFCVAAAMLHGRVSVETFEASRMSDPGLVAMQSRVSMRIDPTLDASAPPLTQARVTVRLRDGRVLTACANGARGYPDRPASDDELAAKFTSCATQTLGWTRAAQALAVLRDIETVADVRDLMPFL
jgi:2-methylcitrate dehydratase PrpD